jgi:hypothetical protein
VYSRSTKILVAVGAILVVLMASVLLAASRDMAPTNSAMASHKMFGPQAIVLTLTGGPMSGMNRSFTVNDIARVGRTRTSVTGFDKPLQGMLNTSKGCLYVSTANMIPSTTRKDFVNNSSIPVAGASIVLALEDINMTGHWAGNKSGGRMGNRSGGWGGNRTSHYKGNMTCHGNMTGHSGGCHALEFSKVVARYPNGTTKTFTLDKPVKVMMSRHDRMVTVKGDASFASLMASLLAAGQTFPANAQPIPLNSFSPT